MSDPTLPPLPSKEAIEYGRARIEGLRDKLRCWESEALTNHEPRRADRCRFAALMLDRDLLGSPDGGCVVTSFDLRYLNDAFRSAYAAALELPKLEVPKRANP